VRVCVAPRAQRQRLIARARTVVVLVCSLAAGCNGVTSCSVAFPMRWGGGDDRDPSDAISITWTLDPSPPVVGTPVVARMTLRDREQKPVIGARLRLEGLMSHPGMAPVVADVVERGDGAYDAPLQFTMAGDWILLVTGQLADGSQLKKRIEIAGVRPAS
jgi:YtkA-like